MKLLNKAGFAPTRSHMAEVLSQCLDGAYNEPFCIIGCASPLFPDEGMCYWNLCISPEQNVDAIGEISATDAKKIIEGYGMEKAEKYGTQGFIYDNPENSFRKAWRGYFTTKELSAIWEDLCKHPDAPSIHMANPAICAGDHLSLRGRFLPYGPYGSVQYWHASHKVPPLPFRT